MPSTYKKSPLVSLIMTVTFTKTWTVKKKWGVLKLPRVLAGWWPQSCQRPRSKATQGPEPHGLTQVPSRAQCTPKSFMELSHRLAGYDATVTKVTTQMWPLRHEVISEACYCDQRLHCALSFHD